MTMKNMQRTIAQLVSVFALFIAGLLSPVMAGDVLHLKDGSKVEGQIVREIDGSVWFKTAIGGIETTEFYLADKIDKIVRDSKTPEVPDATAPGQTEPSSQPRRPGVPRAAVISLEGTVGIQMTAKTLRDILPQLEEDLGTDRQGIVVFKINSGGGLLLEIQRLSDVIHEEYKQRFRVAAWIESAISAAAMTSHCIEEIYFMPQGNYGACTGWSGALVAVKDRGLEDVLYMMERISARGGYNPIIMRAMQIFSPLSASIDESTGEVTWFQSEDQGETLINADDRILTFTSDIAEKFQFSKGTARNLDELTRLLVGENAEIDWVGKWESGYLYPISRAERQMIDFRERVTRDEERLREYQIAYQQAFEAAGQAQNRTTRGAFVGRARQALQRIDRMVKENPNFALLNFNMEPEDWKYFVEDREEELRELLRRD